LFTTLEAPPITRDAVGWLTAYIVLLLFIPSRLIFGPLGSAGAPSMLLGLGSLLLWTLLFLGAHRRVSATPQPIRIALGIFLFSVGISYALATSRPMSPDESSPAVVALLALMSWSGTLLLTHDGIFQRRRLDLLIWRLAVCGGLIAALGLVQVATRRLWVDEISIPGLSSSPGYGLGARGGYPRPAGTSIHPIEYGVVLAIILPLALHVGLHHRNRPFLLRWAPAAAFAGIIPLTSSRSAYLGAAIALVVCMSGWSAVVRIRALMIGALGFLAMVATAPNFVNSVISLFTGASNDPSITSRTDSFAMAMEFFERNPLFGRGLGTFLPKYRIFDNQYLLLIVTIGLVGTLAFLAIAVTAVVLLVRLRRHLVDDSSRDLALALCAAVVAGFACLFMFDAFAFPMSLGALFLILGMVGAFRRTIDTAELGGP
jgi:O-antigen ligase